MKLRDFPLKISGSEAIRHQSIPPLIRDRKGTPKNFCDKDFAERSGELSGAICLKTLVFYG